jgi:thioredoxin 2
MFRCKICGAFNRVPAQRPRGDPVCGKCKQALDVTGATQEVNGEALSRAVASSTVPVLVDFWADWCAPCKMAAPILDQVGRGRAGSLLVLKLDTEANPEPASRFGIRGIPTFILFAGGREIGRQSGVLPKEQLAAWIMQTERSAQSGRASGQPATP